MPAYHQMGHDSANLVDEVDGFGGVVLSPVNYDEEKTTAMVERFSDEQGLDVILDPQLYCPTSERGKLPSWSYFPADVDTAALGDEAWWNALADEIAATAARVGADGVCSPVVLPRAFTNDYYDAGKRTAEHLAGNSDLTVLETVVVRLSDLTSDDRALEIASRVTSESIDSVYLVLLSDIEPRRELRDTNELLRAMKLIDALERSDTETLVSHCSSDVVLWKHAGASSCASGKFFNLRRFSPSRWEDQDGGGGQVAYWMEEGLLAFLREADVGRMRAAGLLSEVSLGNAWAQDILDAMDNGTSWLALSWRFYLHWFQDVVRRIEDEEVTGRQIIEAADAQWGTLPAAVRLMDERENDGSWVRDWSRAALLFDA
ncbi:MAG: hypothetical protein H6839_12110 [Planctomycetes bacterium]|nr:hypothetical protein [Planctomycetota bacterium]